MRLLSRDAEDIRWDKVRMLLASQRGCSILLQHTKSSFEGNNCLHTICQCDPPLSVVEHVAKMNPLLATEKNVLGQTPLHVAAAHHASYEVFKFLFHIGDPAIISGEHDHKGRTLLHILCKHHSKSGRFYSESEILKNYSDFLLEKNGWRKHRECVLNAPNRPDKQSPFSSKVLLLHRALPGSIHLEDGNGLSPLEHAILSGANLKQIQNLHRLSKADWLRQRDERHTNLFRDRLQATNSTPGFKQANIDLETTLVGVPHSD
jgi:hypothetical protein